MNPSPERRAEQKCGRNSAETMQEHIRKTAGRMQYTNSMAKRRRPSLISSDSPAKVVQDTSFRVPGLFLTFSRPRKPFSPPETSETLPKPHQNPMKTTPQRAARLSEPWAAFCVPDGRGGRLRHTQAGVGAVRGAAFMGFRPFHMPQTMFCYILCVEQN